MNKNISNILFEDIFHKYLLPPAFTRPVAELIGGINTRFNAGTVLDLGATIFGSGFPLNFVPSFSWGRSAGYIAYTPEIIFETAEIAIKLKNISWDKKDRGFFLL